MQEAFKNGWIEPFRPVTGEWSPGHVADMNRNTNGVIDSIKKHWEYKVAQARDVAIISAEKGSEDHDTALAKAARAGDLAAVHKCRRLGATNWDWALACAAAGDHIKVMEFCEWSGATAWAKALEEASVRGRIRAMTLCKKRLPA
jgi:hypothetical protein